jgi:hypothetical protein
VKFKQAVRQHADIEALTLYDALLRLPRAHLIARRGIEGQRVIAAALADLERHPIRSDKWTLRFIQLREQLEAHQCEEEEMLYDAAQRFLSDPKIVEEMTAHYIRLQSHSEKEVTSVTRLCSGAAHPLVPVNFSGSEPQLNPY